MARDLTVDMLAGLADGTIRPVFFVEIECLDGTHNVWSGVGDKVWDSKTWTGLGIFGSISDIAETTSVSAVGIVLTLSGIPASSVTLAMTNALPNRPCTVWIALRYENGDIIDDPYPSFAGKTDRVLFDEGGDTASLRINVESELIDLQKSREARYTDAEQRERFPDDAGFEFLNESADATLDWGRPSSQA